MNDVENGMVLYTEPEYKPVYCPHCGSSEFSWLYKQDGEVIGCTECISSAEIWEVEDDE